MLRDSNPELHSVSDADLYGKFDADALAAGHAVDHRQWLADTDRNSEPDPVAVRVSHAELHVDSIEQPYADTLTDAYVEQFWKQYSICGGHAQSYAISLSDSYSEHHRFRHAFTGYQPYPDAVSFAHTLRHADIYPIGYGDFVTDC